MKVFPLCDGKTSVGGTLSFSNFHRTKGEKECSTLFLPICMDASPFEGIALEMVGTQKVKIITVTKLIPVGLSLQITRDY